MLQITEVPNILADKKFATVQDFLSYVYDNQVVIEFWELDEAEISSQLAEEYQSAKSIDDSEYVNL